MIEQIGDIFSQPDADAICFTSNGIVKSNGELTMGAGIAKTFKQRWPTLPIYFGRYVKDQGSRVYVYPERQLGIDIVSFPTKNNWRDQSSLTLIIKSANELVAIANASNWKKCYLTRPGCGLGGLNWETQVKPAIAPILDDRFVILTPK